MRLWLRTSLLFALAPAALQAQRAGGSVEAEVGRVAQQYLDARLANDTMTIRKLLAEEYTGISSTGVLGDRASALRLPMNVTPMGRSIAGFDVDSVRVRVYGSTAVMTGIRRIRSDDSSVGRGIRFTFVFTRRDGRWQLAASQATDLPPNGRSGAPSTSASQASASPVAVVVQLYQDYAWEVVVRTPGSRVGLMDESGDVLANYFDDRLTQLIVGDNACRARTREVCNLSGLPIWNSNDPEAFDLAVVATNDPTVVAVTFRRRYPPVDGTTVRLSYKMVMTPRGWRVQDIISADGGSLVGTLTTG